MNRGFLPVFSFVIVCFLSVSINAQPKEHKMPEGNGTISGIVFDKDNHLPLEGAVLTLFTAKDSTRVKGAGSDSKGQFKMDVPFGMYKLEANFVGYSIAMVNKILVSPKNTDVVLDTIKLTQGSTTTEEIVVESQRSVIEFTPEKKIFNVSETPVSNTGNAGDVLNNVPSVSVDNDGNISLRGSQNVKIMIDGKPITQDVPTLLESIPASSIESVELITNPSARYEAEGETGFINIVLKKNDSFGYNGTVSLSGATRDKYNGSINLNLKNKKVNIYANYNFQVASQYFNGTNTTLFDNTSTVTTLTQPSLSNTRMNSHLGKIGVDYNITDKQVLGFSTTISYRNRNQNENTLYNGFDNTGALSTQSNTNNLEGRKGLNYTGSLTYNAKFKDPRETLYLEATYSHSKDDINNDITNQQYIDNYVPGDFPTGFQNTAETDLQHLAYFQADYSHPFGKDSKLDAGIKSTYRQNGDDFTSTHFNDTINQWVYDNSVSNNFDYKEYINAAYLIFASKIKDFGYQVGLRTEATNTKGTLFTTGQTFDKKYIDFFPSVSLTQKLGPQNEFQASYSRRINRPNLRMINPFIDYSDPLNLKQGNPDINPEYIDSYELSYLRYMGSTIFTSSVFYRQTHGLITRYRTLLDSITTFTTIENLSSAKSYGVELIGNSQITPWWNFSGNFSYYRTDINASNLQADLTNSGYAWTAKFITNFKLPLGLSFSVSYYYLSKRPTALGEIQPLQAMDISLKKEFLGGRASLSARGSDIFNTQQFNIDIANSGFTEYMTRKRDSRNAYLTFTYNFGNMYDKNQKQRKGKKPDDNGNPPEDEDF